MAIAKKPVSDHKDIDAFISGAPQKETQKKTADSGGGRSPCVIRFPPDLLARIDAAAKQRGISRAAWLCMVATRALDSGDW